MSYEKLYKGFDNEGLRNLIVELGKMADRAEAYNKLTEYPEGKLMIADLKNRLRFIREQYKFIDSTCSEAPYLLTMMQSNEREAQEWLERLTNSKEIPRDVEERITAIRSIIKIRKKRQRNDNQLIPDAIRNKEKL